MILRGRDELIKYILKTAPKSLKNQKNDFYNHDTLIYRKTFKGITFNNEITYIEFRKCKFYDCQFDGIWGFFLILNNCVFERCKFKNSRFSHFDPYWINTRFDSCTFMNVCFDEGCLENILFNECFMQSTNLQGVYPISNIEFRSCQIEDGHFQSLVYYEDDDCVYDDFLDLLFVDCKIVNSLFNSVDFINSEINNTYFSKTSFSDCRLAKDTVNYTINSDFRNHASIDFQSILKSDKLDSAILNNLFNIYDCNIQSTISAITQKVKFKSVFISYSFKDKYIVNNLNNLLRRRGVKTFIWEKDAPGGKYLDDIMSSNITQHDIILFISSQNSVKSKACQFEISQGRQKQNETWDNIFYLIHIDDYLFKVKRNQIRPIENRDEYWANIEEIKNVNSVDFSKFNIENPDLTEMETAVNNIVEELKLKNASN